MKSARRLEIIQEYYFSQKLKEIEKLNAEGKKIINLGIGSPDLSPPEAVLKATQEALFQKNVHKYQSYNGIIELRKAINSFYEKFYGISFNPDNEILPLMGSKEGITHISLAYLNENDDVLIPELAYPTYTSVTKMVGANPIYYQLDESKNWEPDWADMEQKVTSKTKIIWLNYPNMPTGAKVSEMIFQKCVDFAIKHNILLAHDNPYSFILNDNPISIFKIPKAKEIALELNSLSKSFNMAGWRIGWVSGQSSIISNILKIKSNMDSGMFLPLQKGAIEALNQNYDWFENLNHIYKERRDKAFELLKKLNCSWQENQVGMFVWAKLKSGNSLEMVDNLLYKNSIFVTPGIIFGEKGINYIRISLCCPVETFEEAINRI